MGKILYIDACGGLSGDMLAGALIGLGWNLDDLRGLLGLMGLTQVQVSAESVEHMGVQATRLEVRAPHEHVHRHLAEILSLLEALPPQVGEPAARVFTRLAQAEAKVHGCSPQEVHFHEVGAIDAIVDVTAFCAGLAWLGAELVVCSPLPLGRGFVDCAHGRLPLPAPAVLNLLEGAPIVTWPGQEETVTPTGAALVSTLASFGQMPPMRLSRTGIGGGSRPSTAGPNIVRLLLGQSPQPGPLGDQVAELVCHIDDQSPEDLPIVFERLLAAGALDVAAAPLLMKKGRPGLQLTVICAPQDAEEMASLVLSQTSSLGLRLSLHQRRILPRQVVTVDSPWGPVRLKAAQTHQQTRWHPEADDVARICRATGLPPAEVRLRLLGLGKE